MKKLIPILFTLVLILALLPAQTAWADCEKCGSSNVTVTVLETPTCYYAGRLKYACNDCGYTVESMEYDSNNHPADLIVTDLAVPATCTEPGKTEGKHCSVCGVVLVAQEVILPPGHTEVTDPAVPATCTEPGKTEGKHCSVCGEVLQAQEEISALGHDFSITVPAREPTCTEAGYTAHQKCSRCGATNGYEELSAKGHMEVILWPGEPATCTESGIKDLKVCNVCKILLQGQERINPLGHDFSITVPAKEPTCMEAGYTAHKKCSRCGVTEGFEEIALLPHELSRKDRIEPTPVAAGVDAYYVCGSCGKMFSDANGENEISSPPSIPPTGCGEKHTPGKAVKENEEIHCVSDSSYDEVVYCTVCKQELSRKHVTYKSSHDYQPWEWHETITRIYYKCTKCGNFYWLHNPESWNMKPGLVRYANGDSVDYKAYSTGPDDDGVLTVTPIKHTERDNTEDISLYLTPDDIYVWTWEKMNRIELVRDKAVLAIDPREITPEMYGLKENEVPDYYVFTLTPSGKDGWQVRSEVLLGEKKLAAQELKGVTLQVGSNKATEITENGVYTGE